MNQTAWIVGGGILVILVAGLLYYFSGNKPIKDFVRVTVKTSMGDIVMQLDQKSAPKTVENFVRLAKSGFYDGTRFHRVIKDFMIQGGDPLSKDETKKDLWGNGGPGYMFDDEINPRKLVRGSVAMANAGKNTNGSQFFIVTKESTPWLDGAHTNFGDVIVGMDVVSKIENTPVDNNDRPLQPVTILAVVVAER